MISALPQGGSHPFPVFCPFFWEPLLGERCIEGVVVGFVEHVHCMFHIISWEEFSPVGVVYFVSEFHHVLFPLYSYVGSVLGWFFIIIDYQKVWQVSEISQYIFPASSDFVFFINCSLTMMWPMAVAVSVVILVGTVIVGIKFCSSTVSKKFLTLSFKFIFRPSMFRSPRMMHIFLSSFIFCSVVSTWLVKWFRHSMVPPGCLYITAITNFLLGCVFRHVSNQIMNLTNIGSDNGLSPV